MHISSYFRSSSARLALTYMALFMVSVSLLGAVTYTSLQRLVEQRAEQELEAEMSHFIKEYNEGGLSELREDIESHKSEYPDSKFIYFIHNKSEAKTKEYPAEPTIVSGKNLAISSGEEEILLLTQALDQGYILGIGSELSQIEELRRPIQQNFGLALLFALLIGMIGSVVMGRRFRSRVEAFNRTAERVGEGVFGERIPLSVAQDDFDDLARIINRMLERIERLVGSVKRVTANVAHDMRTPLGRIRHRLEELQQTHPDLGDEVEEIIHQLDDSLIIFSSILSIADVEALANRERFHEVDLSALLTRLAETYTPVAEDLSMVLAVIPCEGLWVRGDEQLLTQAFANLIENALTHSQATTIALRMQERGAEVVVTVSDDGVGIPIEELAQVTEPFYRLDHSRTSQGHGLGLSLVDAIARAHDAQLLFGSAKPGLEVSLVFSHARVARSV